MKILITITLALLLSINLFGQQLSADDRVTITQNSKAYIGVYAFGYQGLPTPGYPQFQLNNYGGVPGTAAATADNSILGLFSFSGHNGSAKKTVGIIRVKSMDDFATNLSSRMDFLLGPNREQRMTILGDSGFVGIGTEAPTNELDVNGQIRMQSGAMAGYIPVSDADGVMTWTDPAMIASSSPWTENGTNIYKSSGNVSIGTQASAGRLSILGNSTSNQDLLRLDVIYTGAIENASTVGLRSNAFPGDGMGYGAILNGGYRGLSAYGEGGAHTGVVRAIYAEAKGTAGSRYGVAAFATNLGGETSVGVVGVASDATTNYGIYGTASGGTTNYAGYFDGDVTVTGAFTNPSDRKLKQNISKYENALEAIGQLEVKNYEYNTDQYSYMNLDEEKQVGFIAQELEKVLPHLVRDQVHPETTESGDEGWKTVIAEAVDYKAINYIGLIPILTQGIKELVEEVAEKDETINDLKSELSEMEKKMQEMEKLTNERLDQIEKNMSSIYLNAQDSRKDNRNTMIELNGSDQAVLQQNAPNPFSEQTIIEYYLPTTTKTAQMIITDIKGSPLKSVNLENTGLGKVTINANELPVGTYIYTLFVDGRQVESKQMILVK